MTDCSSLHRQVSEQSHILQAFCCSGWMLHYIPFECRRHRLLGSLEYEAQRIIALKEGLRIIHSARDIADIDADEAVRRTGIAANPDNVWEPGS